MSLILNSSQVLVDNVTITSSGNTTHLDKGRHEYLIFFIKVATVTGASAKMDVTIQSSPDGADWFDVEDELSITSAGNFVVKSSNFGKLVRLKYTVTGTTPVFSGVKITLDTKG